MESEKLTINQYQKVSFDFALGDIIYDPYPISDRGQQLDLTQDKCQLLPDRILLNFELLTPLLRDHVKAWISFACKKYANVSLSNHFNILKKIQIHDATSEDEISECIENKAQAAIVFYCAVRAFVSDAKLQTNARLGVIVQSPQAAAT